MQGWQTGEKGLKRNAIGFVEALIIGIASTAPAYSLAAVIGLVVVTVGVQAPAVLLASFVPMFFIAVAFYYLNRADQDAGTTFSWVTRAMEPYLGWLGGWAVSVTGILVIGSLASVASRYTLLLFGLNGAAESKGAVAGLAVGYITLTTLVCVLGIEALGSAPGHPHSGPGRVAPPLRSGGPPQSLWGQLPRHRAHARGPVVFPVRDPR